MSIRTLILGGVLLSLGAIVVGTAVFVSRASDDDSDGSNTSAAAPTTLATTSTPDASNSVVSTPYPLTDDDPRCPGLFVEGRCFTGPRVPEGASEEIFFGTLNGMTFGPDELPPLAQMSDKCVETPAGNNLRDGGAEEAEASDLDFDVPYVPQGARLDYMAASLCEDEVIFINKQYVVDGVGFVQVLRKRGPAVFQARNPLWALEEATLGGREAVVTGQIVYMKDSSSSWYIVTMGFDRAELRKIAESVAPR